MLHCREAGFGRKMSNLNVVEMYGYLTEKPRSDGHVAFVHSENRRRVYATVLPVGIRLPTLYATVLFGGHSLTRIVRKTFSSMHVGAVLIEFRVGSACWVAGSP